MAKFERITPYGGDKCKWGGLKFATFDGKHSITQKRYKIDAVSIKVEKEIICVLSNGDVSDDLG